MLQYLFNIKYFLPTACYKTVFDIDYSKLYEKGNRIILIDLDNTLIPYDIYEASHDHIELFNRIKSIGFKIIIISNNKESRVKKFADDVNCEYVFSALKPLKKGYKRALKKLKHYDNHEIISIGDQLMTDVFGSSRVNIKCILVKPIKRPSEKWYTKINRRLENKILKRIKKNYPDKYHDIISLEENNE